MPKALVLPAALVAAAALAIPALAATKTVEVGDNYFVRDRGTPKVTVARGSAVKWVWKGNAPHNVTVTKGPKKFHSPTMKDGSYAKRFFTPGTYSIVCTIHLPNMKMTLVVK